MLVLAIVVVFALSYHHSRAALLEVSAARLAHVRSLSSHRLVQFFERARLLTDRLAREGLPSQGRLAQLATEHGLMRLVLVARDQTVVSTSQPSKGSLSVGSKVTQALANTQAAGTQKHGSSILNECINKARQRNGTLFSDYYYFAPGRTVKAFLCSAMKTGTASGQVLVAEVDPDQINRLAQFRDSMGAKGQTYLVGADYRLRSDFHFHRQSFNVHACFDGPLRIRRTSVRRALRGQSGALLEINVAQQQVLTSYGPLRLFDSHWAIIAEQRMQSVLAPAWNLRLYFRTAAFLALLIVLYLVYEGLFGVVFPGFQFRKSRSATVENDKLSRSSEVDNSTRADNCMHTAGALSKQSGTLPEQTAGTRIGRHICLALVSLLAVCTVFFPLRFLEPDDKIFHDTMQLFSSGQLARPMDGSLPQGWAAIPRREWLISEKPPLHPAMLAVAHFVGLGRWVNPLWVLVCVFLLYWLGRRIAPDRGARFAMYFVMLFCVNPTLLLMTYRSYMSDLAGAAAVTIFVVLFLGAETGRRTRPRRWRYLLAGLWLGLAVTIRYNNVIVVLMVPLYFMLSRLLRERSGRGAYCWLLEPSIWLLLAGGAAPMVGQAIYNWMTTGSPFLVGYSFTLFQSGDPRFGERFLLHNLIDVPHLLLLGFPSLLLFPLGIVKLYRRNKRVALFMSMLSLLFLVFYISSYWVRADHFIFTSRYYLPALVAISVCAAEALIAFPSRKAAHLAVALLVFFSLSLAGDFFHRYVLSDTWYIRTGRIESQHSLEDLME